ncbi:MAG: hypothetical protein BZ151_11690 [Desulfobacca sp. 4484_104]|nr:MAG: hypothetical protein BZ151_11690 [Desulfobacca sp. 4484_104]
MLIDLVLNMISRLPNLNLGQFFQKAKLQGRSHVKVMLIERGADEAQRRNIMAAKNLAMEFVARGK